MLQSVATPPEPEDVAPADQLAPFTALTASTVLESLTLASRKPDENDVPVQPLPPGAVAVLFAPGRQLTALTGDAMVLRRFLLSDSLVADSMCLVVWQSGRQPLSLSYCLSPLPTAPPSPLPTPPPSLSVLPPHRHPPPPPLPLPTELVLDGLHPELIDPLHYGMLHQEDDDGDPFDIYTCMKAPDLRLLEGACPNLRRLTLNTVLQRFTLQLPQFLRDAQVRHANTDGCARCVAQTR